MTALALTKARAVAGDAPDAAVLGADTVVTVGGEVFGKPDGADHARAMLHRLSGRWHEVVTGIALVSPASVETAAVVSRVLMAELDERRIETYVASGEPFDKAGAYAIQGAGGQLVTGLIGSYTNVIGLPLEATRKLLSAAGVALRPAAAL